MHNRKTNKHRLYVKMEEKGRGLLQIEAPHKSEITDIADYLKTKYE